MAMYLKFHDVLCRQTLLGQTGSCFIYFQLMVTSQLTHCASEHVCVCR